MFFSKLKFKTFILFTTLIVLLIYFPVFDTYFSQDDFFHFKISQTDGSINSFIKLFGFYKFEDRGIAFYRPVSREVLYNFYYNLFFPESLPFRVAQIILHILNISLIFLLIRQLFKDKNLAFLTAFFFAICSANVSTLYYLAGGIQASLAMCFMLLSSICFIKYLEKRKIKYTIFSFFLFLLAIGSHELAFSLPFILTLFVLKKYSFNKSIPIILKELWFFFLALFIYLYLDITLIGFSKEEQQYQIKPSIKASINTLFWYTGWALGLPEMLIDFVNPGFKLNPNLLKYWSNYYLIIFTSFFGLIWILTLNFIYLFSKKVIKKLIFIESILFFSFIFVLTPVLLLPSHKSTYYLYPALPFIWIGIGTLILLNFYTFSLSKARQAKIILSITIFLITVLSLTSTKLGSESHWAASRGKIAEKIIKQVNSTYPNLPKGATIYFLNDPNYPYLTKEWGNTSKQVSSALNNQDGLRLLYKDPTLKVLYQDLDKFPTDSSNLFTLEAKIN